MCVASTGTLYLLLSFAVNLKPLSKTSLLIALRTNTITGYSFSSIYTAMVSRVSLGVEGTFLLCSEKQLERQRMR